MKPPMRSFAACIGLGLVLYSGLAGAAGHAAAPVTEGPSKQQNKMGDCNKEASAKALKGDERKAFMKACLSNKPATQQSKMTTCNQEAAGKKGDERKAFMKACLSG